MSRFPFRTRHAAVAAVAAAVVLAASAPVQGASQPKAPSYVAAASGVMGVAQTVQVSAPRFANRTVEVTVSGVGATTAVSVALNAEGAGSATWIPTATGTWQAQGSGAFAVATGSTFSVAAVPTRTTLYAPNQAQAGTSTTLIATVEATAGALLPLGTVTFSNLFGGVVGSAPLVAGGSGLSTATLNWTPPSIGSYPIVATYAPAVGTGGLANSGASSDTDTVEVVQAQPAMTLRLPSSYRLGSPTTLTALIADSFLIGGTAFQSNVNGAVTVIGGSVPESGGQSQVRWTPGVLGNQIISASFSASNSNASASAQQIVTVQPPLVADPISVAPSGQGPWPLGSAIPLRTNARVAVAASSQSGSPLSMSTSGNCVMIATTLIAASGPGTCTLSVTSPGASNWGSNTARYTFEVTAQR